MMYIVQTVQTLTSTGKTRKARVLQSAVEPFTHSILTDTPALHALVFQLRRLVDICNARYGGREIALYVSDDLRYISAKPKNDAVGSDIFHLHIEPMNGYHRADTIRNTIAEAVEPVDKESADALYRSSAESPCEAKPEGGEA